MLKMDPPIELIHLKTGKKFVLWKLGDFHSHLGYISKDDLVRADEGTILRASTGEEFIVLAPSFIDKVGKLKRGPQTTHWKDIGLILGYTGIGPGWKVVELGTGSGILTIYLANIIRPGGHVYTYEKRKEFFEIAMRNLKLLGLDKYVTMKLRDVYEGIDEKDVDLIISDIKRPWEILDIIYESLKVGGFFIALFPNITSVYELVNNLDRKKFIDIHIFELILREWISGERVLRPKHHGLLHTEFVVLSRKI